MKTFADVGYLAYLGLSCSNYKIIEFAGLTTRLKHLLKVVTMLHDIINEQGH